MKKIMMLLACITLSACSTTGLAEGEPIFSAHSNKTADSMNQCLAPIWVSVKPSSTSVPTETGYQISSSDDFIGAVSLVKIDRADDGGSDVKVYALSKGLNDPWGKAARKCI